VLDRQAILEALHALDEELGSRGVRANVFVVGGAAMAMAYDARRSTADVDAVFAPADEVRRAAAVVADRLGIPDDWLNDGAKAAYPQYAIPPRTRFMLEEMFPTPEHQRGAEKERDTGFDIGL